MKHFKHVMYCFLFFVTTGLTGKPLLIFDINSLIPCRDSWLAAVLTISENKKLTKYDDTYYYSVPLGTLLPAIGIQEKEYKAYIQDVWDLFAQKQEADYKSYFDVCLWGMLSKLKDTFDLSVITPNKAYVQTLLEKTSLNTYIKHITYMPYSPDFQIEKGFFIVPKRTENVVGFTKQQKENPIFVTQSLDFAYDLHKAGLTVIGGGWHWHTPEAFTEYLPDIPCVSYPAQLPAVAEYIAASGQ